MIFQHTWLSVICGFMLFILPCCALSAEDSKPLQIRYYHGGTIPDYAVKLLQLALEKSNKNYKLTAVTSPMTISRVIKMVEDNDKLGPNIYWAAHSRELEQRLAAIYFPIDRGLISYRVMVIDQDSQIKISQAEHLGDLTKFRFIQGFGWSDTMILRKSGIKVEEGLPQNLYKMLMHKRGDVFPRSILDVEREFNFWKKELPNLRIEKNIALLYQRFMVFFFVSKENVDLHAAVNEGLNRAFEDGSFMELFLNDPDISNALKMLEEHRRVIRVPMPPDDNCQTKISDDYIDRTIFHLGWSAD